jgi:hypothetical protein
MSRQLVINVSSARPLYRQRCSLVADEVIE